MIGFSPESKPKRMWQASAHSLNHVPETFQGGLLPERYLQRVPSVVSVMRAIQDGPNRVKKLWDELIAEKAKAADSKSIGCDPGQFTIPVPQID